MLHERERAAIDALWTRKLAQDARDLPQAERCRNLEPDSAELISALAAAARRTGGRLVSLEIEPERQAESRRTLGGLGLDGYVDYVLADAGTVLDRYDSLEFVLIDCEKDDYGRFFDQLRLAPGAIVVADNVLSHDLSAYVRHVRSRPGIESVTLPIGKGLEVSRLVRPG